MIIPTPLLALTLIVAALLVGCSASNVDTRPATLGTPDSMEAMRAQIDEPGPIVFEKHLAANNGDISAVVSMAMNIPALDVKLTTSDLEKQLGGIDGVFLTHIHMDHVMGLTDIPPEVPVYSGPGETTASSALNLASQGTTDRLLANVGALQEWQFSDTGVVDIFGDGSVWAIHTPGHQPL